MARKIKVLFAQQKPTSSSRQASMSTIAFLLPPFEAVHNQQSALGMFFTINESFFSS